MHGVAQLFSILLETTTLFDMLEPGTMGQLPAARRAIWSLLGEIFHEDGLQGKVIGLEVWAMCV